ncbi:MAG: hypothetical protein AAF611_08520 [Bacteroidota bacterium]
MRQIQKLRRDAGEKFIFRLLNYLTIIIVLLIISGFILEYLKINKDIPQINNEKEITDKTSSQFKFLPIENINQKIETLKFNNLSKDTIVLRFKSKEWNIDCKFKADSNLKLHDLKEKLINHFELRANLEPIQNDLNPTPIWNIHVNHIIIDNEAQSLKEVGIQKNDVITLSVIAEVIMIHTETKKEGIAFR